MMPQSPGACHYYPKFNQVQPRPRMWKFTKNEKPPRLHGEIVKFLGDSITRDPTLETEGSVNPSPQGLAAKRKGSVRHESTHKPRIAEASHEVGKLERATFNENSGSQFFQKAAHKSQKEFSGAKSGFHETFSFGRPL